MWNVLGCANFFAQTSPESVAALPEPYRAAIAARPAWIRAAFAIAVLATAMAMFQHANIRTPRWIGYVVQRPESHAVHHGRATRAALSGSSPRGCGTGHRQA